MRVAIAGALAVAGAVSTTLASGVGHTAGIVVGSVGILSGSVTVVLELLKSSGRGHKYEGPEVDVSGESPTTVKKGLRAVKPLCWLGIANGWLLAWILIHISVRLAAPDAQLSGFPESCPEGLPIGCSRVARSNPNRPDGMEPFVAASPSAAVAEDVRAWASANGGRLLQDKTGPGGVFLHYRFLSQFMGFPDDMMVSVSCEQERSVVEVQGQLRVGYGDMGVNTARNTALLQHLAASQAGLEPGKCTGS